MESLQFEPRREKTCLRGVRHSVFQTSLLNYRVESSPAASLHMILSKKRITKAMIRLRGCAGLSAETCGKRFLQSYSYHNGL